MILPSSSKLLFSINFLAADSISFLYVLTAISGSSETSLNFDLISAKSILQDTRSPLTWAAMVITSVTGFQQYNPGKEIPSSPVFFCLWTIVSMFI